MYNTLQRIVRQQKLICGLLMFCISVAMLPVQVLATDTDTATTCYDYTVKLVEDTYRYLDEIYIEKYPELGLRFCYGGPDDEKVLWDLVTMITDGCTTEKEKANAINAWVERNIVYTDTCPFPIETFYSRSGACLNYAMFLSTLFRMAGIPATWGDGWRGDMEALTLNDVFSAREGHAWCFAHVDGEWVLYDPLWLDDGITDKEYIAKSFYFQMVEGITPVYDTEDFPPYANIEPNWYWNGRFYANQNLILNWSLTLLTTGYSPYDGYSYVDSSKDESIMVDGEAYRDGWLWAGSKVYMYENGIQAAGVVLSDGGKQYYFDVQSGHAFEVLCDPDDYSIIYGFFSVEPGYTGIPLKPTSEFITNSGSETYSVKWESDSSIATVDENGVITAVKPGQALISAHFYRDSDGAYMGSGCAYSLYVCENHRVANYSDSYTDHTHQYKAIQRESTVDQESYIIYTCTVGDCAHSHIGPGSVPVSTHTYTSETMAPSCTEGGYITYTCTCGHQYIVENTEPIGHTWEEWKIDEYSGKTIRKCQNCDAQEIQGVVAEGRCGDDQTWELSDQGVLTVSGQGKMYDYNLADTPWISYGDILTQIVIEDGITSIGDFAFMELDNLISVRISDTVTSIGTQAFWTCDSITSIEIPGSVISLGSGVFSQCSGLEEIYFEGNAPLFGDEVFFMVEATVYCHRGTSWPSSVIHDHGGTLTWDIYGDHTHDYTTVVMVAPTCTAQGYASHNCTICGYSYQEVTPQLDHTLSKWVETSTPTCTEDGVEMRDCKNCDYFEMREIDAVGHDYKSIETAPTCTEQGYTTHACSCGDSYVDSYVEALGHTEAIDEAVSAGCTTTGLTEGKHCSVCNEVLIAQAEIEALGHTEVIDAGTAATCTTAGKTEGKHCSVCNEVLIPQTEIPATGHSHISAVTAPTCTEQGYTTYTCTCGDSYIDSYVEATGHSWRNWSVSTEATENAPGEKIRYCNNCTEYEIEEIPQLEHTHKHSAVVTAPTCTEQGYTTHICTCGDSYIDSHVEALGHTESIDEAVAAGCTTTGLTEGKHCAVCNEVLVAQTEIPATGHSHYAIITDPTCTELGYTTYTCACGDSYVDTYVDATGHSWGDWSVTTEATENALGEKVRYCGNCTEYQTEEIPQLEHTHKHSAVVTAPTCTEQGYTTHTCSCGDSYVDSYVAVIEHSYADGICTSCGAVTPKPDVLLGDANGDGFIDFSDAVLVLEYGAFLIDDSQIDLSACDVNGDGSVDFSDAVLILEYSAFLITEFPAAK